MSATSASGNDVATPVEAPPGFYVDPRDANQFRYWNGVAWTDQVVPANGQRPSAATGAPKRGMRFLWIPLALIGVAFVIGLAFAEDDKKGTLPTDALIGAAPSGTDLFPEVPKISIKEYGKGFTGHVGGLTAGHGKLWFTEQFDDRMGFFDLKTHTAHEFDVPKNTFPHNAYLGPDGNIWFTGLKDNIGIFNVKTHKTTEFKKGISPGSEPHVIITDPTNSRFMWFTEYTSGHLARFDRKTHKIREFKLASKDVAPHGIVPDPNGTAMWWCEQRADGFGRLDLSNGPINTQADFDRNYKQFLGLPKGAGPHDPLFGPDDAIYTTLQDSQQLGRFDLKTEKFSVHDAGLAPYAGHLIGEAKTSTAPTRSLYTLAVSPDNKYIFFTVLLEGALGRYNIKTHQVVLIRHGITPGGGPLFVAPGPDGHLWFSEVNLNPIEHGRLARVTES